MSERTCPHCQMVIYDDEALLCHHCGESLSRASGGAMGFFHSPWMKVIGLIIFVLIALSLIF